MMSDETLISFFAWYGLAMLWVIMIVALTAVFLRKGGNRRG